MNRDEQLATLNRPDAAVRFGTEVIASRST